MASSKCRTVGARQVECVAMVGPNVVGGRRAGRSRVSSSMAPGHARRTLGEPRATSNAIGRQGLEGGPALGTRRQVVVDRGTVAAAVGGARMDGGARVRSGCPLGRPSGRGLGRGLSRRLGMGHGARVAMDLSCGRGVESRRARARRTRPLPRLAGPGTVA